MHMDREGVFRNRTPGQEARREDLLRKRRDDLAVLPHAMRRVYVGRFARMLAGAFGFVAGLVLVGAAFSPAIYSSLESILPGPKPAVLASVLGIGWVSMALGYFLARSAGEHRFAVAMSRCVLPADDLESDVERLASETPGAVGHRMARRIEVRASSFPVAAFSLLLPATLIYTYLGLERGGYPRNETVDFVFGAHSGSLLAIGIFGCLASLTFFSSRMRTRKALGPLLLGAASTSCVTLLALAAGAGVVWPIFGMAIVLGGMALASFLLARDRVKLDAEDPNAGAETFEFRRVYDWLRAAVVGALRLVHPRNLVRGWRRMKALPKWQRRAAFVSSAALVAGLVAGAVVSFTPERAVMASDWDISGYGDLYDEDADPYQGKVIARQDGLAMERGPIRAVAEDGAILAYASFHGRAGVGSLRLTSDAWLTRIPVGWQVNLMVELVEIQSPSVHGWREVSVSPVPGNPAVEPQILGAEATRFFSIERCSGSVNPRLGLEVLPTAGDWESERHTVVLKITPELRVADCSDS